VDLFAWKGEPGAVQLSHAAVAAAEAAFAAAAAAATAAAGLSPKNVQARAPAINRELTRSWFNVWYGLTDNARHVI